MTVAELVVKIRADATEFAKDIKDVDKMLDNLEKSLGAGASSGEKAAQSFERITRIIKNSAFIGAIIAFDKAVIDLTKDFAAAELAATRLEKIGEIRGLRTASDEISNLAGELQKLTGASDDYTKQLGAELLAQGKSVEQTKRILMLAADLSAVTGQDLATSVRQLATTYSGMAGQLGKLNPELKDLTEEQLRNGAAIDILEKKYKGMAKELQGTTSVAFARLSENWGDLRENLGAIFAPMVTGLVNLGNKVLEFVNKGAPAFKVLGEAVNVVYSLIVGTVGGVAGFGVAVNNLSPKVKKLWDIVTGKANADKEAAEQAMRHKESMAIVERSTKAYQAQIEKTTKTVEQYTDAQLASTKAILQNAIAATRDAQMRERLAVELMVIEKEQAKRAEEAAKVAKQAAADRLKANQATIDAAKQELKILILQEQERARINGEEVDRAKIREAIIEKYLELLKLQDEMTPAMREQVKAILAMADAWQVAETDLNTFKEQTRKTTGEVDKLDDSIKATDESGNHLVIDFTEGFEEATDAIEKGWGAVAGFAGSIDDAQAAAVALAKDFSKLLMSSKNEGAAAAGAVLSITTTIFETIDKIANASKNRIKALGDLNRDIRQQTLQLAIDAVDAQMKAELKAKGFIEKSDLRIAGEKRKALEDEIALLGEQFREAQRVGDRELAEQLFTERAKKKADLEEAKREEEKQKIIEKYNRQRQEFEIQMAKVQKEIALAQAAVDRQKAIAALGIFATAAQKQEVNALYDRLVAAIGSVPLPTMDAATTLVGAGGAGTPGTIPGGIGNFIPGVTNPSGPPTEGTGGGGKLGPTPITVNIYSPTATTPSAAAAVFNQTARELAFVGVL